MAFISEKVEQPGPIHIEEYNYELPDERIARFPQQERDGSLLLSYSGGRISHGPFSGLPSLVPESSLMIYNDTKVVRARMHFRKSTGASIEIFCLEPVDPSDYQLAFSATESVVWKCLVGNARKWKGQSIQNEVVIDGKTVIVNAQMLMQDGNSYHIRFYWEDAAVSFGEILEFGGVIPIPPYLQREAVTEDNERYQTVYSRIKGSVAAPTAGLHFTDSVFRALSDRGIKFSDVTLHVGAGTFVPVKEEDATKHRMHEEEAIVSKKTLLEILRHEGPVIAVGTTTTRTLESLFWLGVKYINGYQAEYERLPEVEQWDPYTFSYEPDDLAPLEFLVDYLEKMEMDAIVFRTGIMITPGYRFRIVRGLVTNFHQPGSTLLLLIAAFIGDRWRDVYKYALQNGFRFLSYGDSSLLFP